GFPGQLAEVLVRQDEGQVVAAGFGADLVDGVGQVQEVVAFVDDQYGVAAVGVGLAGAGGGGLPQGGGDERAKNPGGVVADDAFGEPAQQDATIEHLRHAE